MFLYGCFEFHYQLFQSFYIKFMIKCDPFGFLYLFNDFLEGVDIFFVFGFHSQYDIVVLRQITDSFTEEDFNSGIKYLEEVYGAKICDLDDFIARI